MIGCAALVGASPAAASTQEPATVRCVEIARQLLYLPLYAGIAKGHFARHGVRVELQTGLGPDKTTAILTSGGADIALQGPETAVVMAQGGRAPMRIFAALTATDGMVLVSRENIAPESFRWTMLRGRAVIGRRASSTPGLFLQFALRSNGLNPHRDVEYIDDIPIPLLRRTWTRGRGDFAIFFEPTVSRLAREGEAFPVAAVGETVGRIDYTVFMAEPETLRKKGAALRRWGAGLRDALRWVADASPEDAVDAVAGFFGRGERVDMISGFRGYRALGVWKSDPSPDPVSLDRLQSMMIENGVMQPKDRVASESLIFRGIVGPAPGTMR